MRTWLAILLLLIFVDTVAGVDVTSTVPATSQAATASTVAPGAPRLVAAEQIPAKSVHVTWQFDQAKQKDISGFLVERADLPSHELRAISKLLPANAREYTDSDPKRHQQAYAYRVTGVTLQGPSANSAEQVVIFFDAPLPPKPAGLKLTPVSQQGKRFIKMTWEPKNQNDTLTSGYRLFADDMVEGEVLRQASLAVVKGTEYLFEVSNKKDRKYTLGIAAVGPAGQEGPRLEATCVAPGSLFPPVETLRATRDMSKPETVRIQWTYVDNPLLLGFEVIRDGKVLAGPKVLDARARHWDERVDAKLLPMFEVVAISKGGQRSQPVSVVTETLGGAPAAGYLMAPASFTTQWDEREGKRGILLRWDSTKYTVAPAKYLLAVDSATFASVETPKAISLAQAGEYWYLPQRSDRAYTLRLYAESAAGTRSVYSESLQPAPGAKLVPPVLGVMPQEIASPKGNRLQWAWRYKATPDLKGFRVYIDDALVVGEDLLDGTKREWTTTDPVSTSSRHRVEIEAVATDGSTSGRSPARFYGFNP